MSTNIEYRLCQNTDFNLFSIMFWQQTLCQSTYIYLLRFYYIKCGTQENINNFPHFHVNFHSCKIHKCFSLCIIGCTGKFGHPFGFSTFHPPPPPYQVLTANTANTATTTVPQNNVTNIATKSI